MTAEDLWKMFCEKESLPFETKFDAWQFGGAPDYLAALVMQKIKTATASGYDLYFIPGAEEKLPQTGDYSVIEDSKGQAVCVIQTTKIAVIPFDEVSNEHAYKEGEGDRSLTYWRKVHKEFFEEDFGSCGVKFDLTSKILCEEFELVYSLYDVVPFLEADAKDICKWTYEDDYAVYNYPSWDECVNMQISFTNEETRREQYYKVLKAGERLGYFRLEKSDNTIELSVGIAPDKCSGGNGDMLINLALAKISELYPGKKIILTVRPFNKRAIRVYEKAGFKIVKEYCEDRYLVPGPMLLMEMISR
ncbi:MAG: GNAT family N-acetyltransferase [Eubacteriales bacterium]|nr:GNAT family N-acetyltransferase [Eubacteriales bacterium]